MKLLVIKLSSLGDVLHAMPAVTDAARAIPNLAIDWVVEPGFSEIPGWHPAVNQVITIPIRQWRHRLMHAAFSGEILKTVTALRRVSYDWVLDAQGLFKSSFFAKLARGPSIGMDRYSAKEGLSASMLYDQTYHVDSSQHAVTRLRCLFAKGLQYTLPVTEPDFGLVRSLQNNQDNGSRTLVFCVGSSWVNKQWPKRHWEALIKLACDAGYRVVLPWGSSAEHACATQLSDVAVNAAVFPKSSLTKLMQLMSHAEGVVAGDTGLTHLAAALSVPTVALYGPTNATLTGALGTYCKILTSSALPCAPCVRRTCSVQAPGDQPWPPCMAAHLPQSVWQHLQQVMAHKLAQSDRAPA